jgi:hypothetical protein
MEASSFTTSRLTSVGLVDNTVMAVVPHDSLGLRRRQRLRARIE